MNYVFPSIDGDDDNGGFTAVLRAIQVEIDVVLVFPFDAVVKTRIFMH